MSARDSFEITLGVLTVFGFFFTITGFGWKASQLQSEIYKEIDKVHDNIREQLNLIDKRLDLHVQESQSSRHEIFYRLDGLGIRLGEELNSLKKRASGAIVFERLEEKLSQIIEKLP